MLVLLLARIVLYIDTREGIYRVSVGRVFRFDLEWPGAVPQPVIRILGWEWRPGFTDAARKKPERKQKGKGVAFTPGRLKPGLLKSFRLRRFELELDTGDYVLNAQLYPVNHIVYGDRVHISINWQNQDRLLLVLESRVIRILYHIVKIKTS